MSSLSSDVLALERNLRSWFEQLLGHSLPLPASGATDLISALRDGKVLLEVIQRVNPGSAVTVSRQMGPAANTENVRQFLAECRSLGVLEQHLFSSEDLASFSPDARVRVVYGLEAIVNAFAQRGRAPPLASVSHGASEVSDTMADALRSGESVSVARGDAAGLRMLEALVAEGGDDYAGFHEVPPGSETVFKFEVGEPNRVRGEGKLDRPYVTYTIRAKCHLPQYSQSDVVAQRRYKDFEYLRERLVENFPGIIVPPIPPKSATSTFAKFVAGVNDDTVVEYRVRALSKFLNRVGAIPSLAQSTVLQHFLESDPQQVAAERKGQVPPTVDANAGPSANVNRSLGEKFRALTISMGNAFKSRKHTTSGGEPDWLDATAEYNSHIEVCISSLRDRVDALVKRRRELATFFPALLQAFTRLGETERQYDESALADTLNALSGAGEVMFTELTRQANDEVLSIVETLMYYQGMCEAVREQVNKLSSLRLTQHLITTELEQKKARREAQAQAGKDILKMDEEVLTLTQRSRSIAEVIVAFEAVFREDLERYQRLKQDDLRRLLGSFVRVELQFAQQTKKFWEDLMPTVEALRRQVEA